MNNSEYIPYEAQLLDDRWIAKRSSIIQRDNHRCKMCGYSNSKHNQLNVHHRYYVYNAMAWEYEDDALVTLCHHCHMLIHKSLSPLQYLQKGDKLEPLKLTPCSRCNGAGYFPEFKHVLSGKCFRCHGERYEELINPGTDFSIKDYIALRNDIFDVINTKMDDEYLEDIYQKARNYHLGINGFEINSQEAYRNYYIAAINGYGKAQNNLGYMYKYGLKDFAVDYKIARRWFIYAAMQGIPQAQSNLIDIFNDGMGVTKSALLAKEWELLACNNDDEINSARSFHGFIKAIMDNSSIEEKRYYLSRFLLMYLKGNNIAKEIVNRNLEKADIDYINKISRLFADNLHSIYKNTSPIDVESLMISWAGEEMDLPLFIQLHGECKPKEYISGDTGEKKHLIVAMDGSSVRFSQELEDLITDYICKGEKLKLDKDKLKIREYILNSTGEKGFIAYYP